jgi:cytochrome b561
METEMLKTRPDRYGTVAVSIHWLSAITVLPLPAQPTERRLLGHDQPFAMAGSLAGKCQEEPF